MVTEAVSVIQRLSLYLKFHASVFHAQLSSTSLQTLILQSGILCQETINPVLNLLPLHNQPGLVNSTPEHHDHQPGFKFRSQCCQRSGYCNRHHQHLQYWQQQTKGHIGRHLSFKNSSNFQSSSHSPRHTFDQNTKQGIRTFSLSASSHTSTLASSVVLSESSKQDLSDSPLSDSSTSTNKSKNSTTRRHTDGGTSRLSPAVESNASGTTQKQDSYQRGVKRPHTSGGSDAGPQQRPRIDSPAHTKPVHLPRGSYPQMTTAIKTYYVEHLQTDDMFKKKMLLRESLYPLMKKVFPYCGLYVTGSSMNGFGSSYSDMDLCLMLSNDKLDQKREATEILRVLQSSLRRCSFLTDIQLIKATVPILKFTDIESDVECDLNVNNAVGIRNTHLLYSYTKMDPRLAPLVVFVKHWAKFHNINDANHQTISSYSLTLMVIHFLQCGVYPPVLPCLQQLYPNQYGPDISVQHLKLSNDSVPHYTSQNALSSGELFLLFLRYYTQDINLHQNGLSIRTGKTMNRSDLIINSGSPARQWKFLCIEEPYNLSNTARSVYNNKKWHQIMAVFRESFSVLAKTGDIKQIVSKPFKKS